LSEPLGYLVKGGIAELVFVYPREIRKVQVVEALPSRLSVGRIAFRSFDLVFGVRRRQWFIRIL
jgi:hypothetical protein